MSFIESTGVAFSDSACYNSWQLLCTYVFLFVKLLRQILVNYG